jgi:hypothetical protein
VAHRVLAPPRLLVASAEQLRDPAQLYRGGDAGDRSHLCHCQWRHRSLGRRCAGAGGCGDRLQSQSAGPRPGACHLAWTAGGQRRWPRQRGTDGRFRPFGLHRNARHVLHRARTRGLDRRRAATDRISRRLQPYRAQACRHLPVSRTGSPFRHSERRQPGRQRPDAVDVPDRHRRRRDPGLHAVRPKNLRDRRQPPRRRICRHQHQARTLRLAGVFGRLRGRWPG